MATTDILRSMIAYWKTFDLQKLQEELDRTASILAVRSEEADISRQLLLQKSRDFKRNTPDDIQKAIAPLLKSFQSEIDGLLRRSKLAESAFLSIYKKVIHIPDMLPVLMAAEQLQSKVKRLSGCSAGFSSEEMKELGSENKNKYSQDDDVCVVNRNSLNFESNEPHQNNRENTDDDCMYPCRVSDLPSGDDAVDPLHNFTTSGVSSELPSDDDKEQNSSIHDRNAADAVMRNADIVTLCDNQSADSSAGLQGQATAFRLNNELDSSEIQDLGKTDRTDTGQSEGAMDDVATEEVDEGRSAISEDCRAYMDHRMDCDHTRVILKDQTEPEADSLSDGCGSSIETRANLSIHRVIGGDQNMVLDSVESNGELDCAKEQTLENAEAYHWNNVSHLEDGKEVQNCKQIFARKFGEDKGMSGISLFSVESLASEIGQEVVSSFQSSQFPAQNLWLPDTETSKEESSSLLSSSADVLSTYAVQYSSEFPVNCWDSMPNDVKTETADELASLDTTDVSRQIREILSFHNLGQRLFARYVLGLSQGTVSELLSKPKPWEKLTEKGRESYRKMHQWASDERNIQMLKSLSSPKCNVSSSSSGHADSAAEERIAQILSEAQAAMQCKQEAIDKSSVVSSPKASEMQMVEPVTETEKGSRKPKTSRKGSGHTSGSRSDASKSRKVHADSENLTREIVARIYQEELEKLAQVAEASGNMVELLNYRQELARLSQGWTKQPCKPDAQKSETEDKENQKEMPKAIAVTPKKHLNDRVDIPMESIGEVTDEPQDLSISGSAAEACQQSQEGINLSILKPCDSPTPLSRALPVSLPSSSQSNGLLSPLQRMQSIANSLMLQSSSSPTGFQPTRAVLPPISQEQFDLYANINTDDLVKQVKDVLSQYSISQRLFGEYVLGLSQGSVSDLLARPKPWHLLTQKGREPFIRMQMFIDDPEAVQKLVASQYRVPTEKLLRSNSSSHLDAASHGMVSDSCGEVAECCSIPPATPQSSKPFRSLTTSCGNATPPCSTVHSSSSFTTVSSPQSTSGSMRASFSKPLANGVGFPSMGVAVVPSVLSLFGATFLPSAQFGPLVNMDMHHLYGSGLNAAPSEAGISTAGPELDTQAITARVKEVLQLNNLGQKLFGEAVLELSQGSVSELLSKPKPWHMLSLKGREPFVKMQIWLGDPLGVQKLHTYQTHMSGRRRKSGCDGSSNDKPGNQKKPRLFFSEEQKEALKSAYLRDPYPNQLAIEQLANELDIGVKTVINWFHNHRMRAKQHHSCNSPTSTTAGSPSSSILTRIKSEVHDDLAEQGPTRSAITFPQEDNSASSNSCRSRCNSGTFSGLDGRGNKLASNVTTSKSESSFSSSVMFSCSKNGNLNKRKRARPHRLCSGAADTGDLQVAEEYQVTLDVAIDLSVNRPRGNADKDHPLALKRDSTSCGLESRGETVKSQSDDSLLQSSDAADVKSELPDNWNDNRVKNIKKLQQNLLLAPSDDWEF